MQGVMPARAAIPQAEKRAPRLATGLTRTRLLELLRVAGGARSVRQLATELRLHPNSLREHLDQLVAAGLAERVSSPPTGRGRPPFRYRASPELDAAAPYRELARVLADELRALPDPEVRAIAAGERWGRRAVASRSPAQGAGHVDGEPSGAASLVELMALLETNGFDPEQPVQGGPIRLRRCPFGQLAADRQGVVCGVHLGLMRGALEQLGAPFDAVRLEPFVEPSLCVAHLGPREG